MILKVNKDICEIKQNEVWNVGDYNVHVVQVELSEEFDGLVNKVRYFTEDNSYDMLITNNIAGVPYEATLTEGTIKIGVYGYDADTNILVQSTSPVNKYISSGTYTGEADNTEPLTPTDKQQMETAIQKNTNDIVDLKENKQDKLISGVNIKTINNESILSSGNLTLVAEETDPIFTNSPAYSITDNDITYWNNKANMSDIPDVSNFITKDVDDLTYYTKSTDMQTAINNAVDLERTARENADNSLQNQIDAITVSSDVVDVVSTYQDLVDYDTQHIKANDIIKVMQDSTHDNAISYYRWVIVNHVGSWEYVGSEGPYYTKSETDTLLNAKQNTITNTNKLQSDLVDDTNQTNLFVTSEEKTAWNNKLDQSDLTDYVKNTDYATSNKGGVVKANEMYNFAIGGPSQAGIPLCAINTYEQYESKNNYSFISKGTLENVITGKNLETANNKVTSISSDSTDVQYPTAKCVYDNDVIIKDDVNTKYDYLFSLTNLFGKITGTGTSVTLNDTSNTIMKLNLDTTTSSQEDTPTPSSPQEVHTISGDNTITISNSDNTKSQEYPINLGVENIITTYKTSGSGYINWNYDNSKMKKQMTYSFIPNFSTTNATIYMRATDGSSAMNLGVIPTITSGTVASLSFTLTDEELNSIKSTTGGFIQVYRVGVEMSETSLTNVQLEEGTKVNSYSPYNQTPIELCKIGDYQDILFKNTINSEYYNSSLELNKWYIRKIINKISSYNGETITTSFISTTGGLNTGATIYYVSDSPTYTLLNDTLQTQLNNLQYALAYDTQTNISQTNNDLPFIIDAETYTKINVPTKTSDLTNDSGFITGYTETDPTVPSHVKNITQANITSWNNKSDFSGNYNDLTNKPTIPTVPTNVSAFTNDVGYLTQHQDISGKANKISVVQTSASTIEINPNTFYKFGEVASLNITLASITDNTIYNEYMFEFVSGTTATTLTLPSSIKWLKTPTIDANKIYQCSIVDNIGLLVGVDNA